MCGRAHLGWCVNRVYRSTQRMTQFLQASSFCHRLRLEEARIRARPIDVTTNWPDGREYSVGFYQFAIAASKAFV